MVTTKDIAESVGVEHKQVLRQFKEMYPELCTGVAPYGKGREVPSREVDFFKWSCTPKRIPLEPVFDFDGEEFRVVPNTESRLAVSRSGRAIGRSRTILKPRKQSSGYLWYSVYSEDGVYSNVYAHRAVALAFIPNPDNKEYVNHKDGDKYNNHIDNLEWVTAKENMKHAFETGLAWNLPRAGECGFRRMTRASNRQLQAKLLKEQGGLCLICGMPIVASATDKQSQAVTDHIHNETGAVRAVLHRGCNGFLGKAEATTRWAGVSASDNDRIAELLINAGNYLLRPATHIQYHSHKSEDDKRAARALAQKKRRAAQSAKLAMKRGQE